jgi:hypothetical protein
MGGDLKPMSFRKILFRIHLGIGCLAGVVVFIMSTRAFCWLTSGRSSIFWIEVCGRRSHPRMRRLLRSRGRREGESRAASREMTQEMAVSIAQSSVQ